VSAALHGAGLACLASFRADREAGLRRIPVPPPVPTADIWLVVHRDSRATPRIHVVLTLITEYVLRLGGKLEPDPRT
jgi:DNA-binding transcriptional LysR family regulator